MSPVEVLANWDPDGGGRLRVFVDGTEVEAQVEWVDPGRGYERHSWREHTEHVLLAEGYSPAFRDAIVNERDEVEDSRYIDGEDPGYLELIRDEGEEPEVYRWRVSYWQGLLATLHDDDVHTTYSTTRAGNDALGAWLIGQGYTNVHLEEWDAEIDQGPLNRGWGLYAHMEAEDQA